MKTQHKDKVEHVLGNADLRKFTDRVSHVLSEKDGKEIFTIRWGRDTAIILKTGKATKAERREWLLAFADALEDGLWA